MELLDPYTIIFSIAFLCVLLLVVYFGLKDTICAYRKVKMARVVLSDIYPEGTEFFVIGEYGKYVYCSEFPLDFFVTGKKCPAPIVFESHQVQVYFNQI